MINKKLPIDYVKSRNKNYFLFKQDIGLTSTIREGNLWEPHLYNAIKNIDFENTTIIDVGANLGSHTLEFADLVGDKGLVYAFEPQRIVYYQLCANIIANGYNNINAINKALSNKNGITCIEKQNFYLDGLLNIGDTHISNFGDEVEETKLDEYNLNNISLLKIDVQGYEYFVLEGCIETIKRNKPIILVEIVEEHSNLYNKTKKDIFEFLESISYEITNIEGWDYMAIPKIKKAKIDHIYDNIEGWFDFEKVYTDILEKSETDSHFIEVGAWLGKSASYMAVEIANSNKNIRFDVVDTWEGSEEEGHKNYIDGLEITLYEKFLDNIKSISSYINPIKGHSTEVAKTYEDNSLDFVFLDASHDYNNVKKDIEAWYPKVKSTGYIAGHDYNEEGIEGTEWLGVVKAVNEFFGKDNITIHKVHAGTWVVKKSDFEKSRKVKHIYQDIPGYFDFQEVYTMAVDKFESGSHFVEIGAAWGCSASYMAVEIANSKKDIKFDVVDIWINPEDGTNFYDKFYSFIEPVKNYINPIVGDSKGTASLYENESLDFVFIDASHDYDNVKKDILAWLPKVKSGGIIAGHDYSGDFPGVIRAVNEVFQGQEIRQILWSWIVIKKENDHKIEIEKIMVMSCCYNEIKILPFYLDYYLNVVKVDKILIYDGGSTDGSLEMMRLYPQVEVVVQKNEKLDDRELNGLRNNGWKLYRFIYDWIFVCDMDEFLYHPNLRELLISYNKRGISIPLIEGFDMISKEFPKCGDILPNTIKTGIKESIFLNKTSIFRSNVDINYDIGCHSANPINGIFGDKEEIKLLHYKWLSHEYLTGRSSNVANRLSDWNLSGGCGSHNRPFSRTTLEEFNNRFKQSDNVFNSRPTPPYGRGGFVPATEYLLKNLNHNPIIVEIGTQRNFDNTGDGSSTSFFSQFINRYGGKLYSIDIENSYIENGKIELGKMGLLNENINLICEDGIKFLENFKEKIDFLYLDGWDYNGSDEDKKLSEDKHLECYLTSKKSLSENHLILIDDIMNGITYEGKGHLLIPHLLENKYDLILNEWQFLFSKKKTKLIIFSHNYLINNWEEILDEQLSILKSSGLYNSMKWMSLGYYSNNTSDSNKFVQKILNFDSNKKMTTLRHEDNFFEYPTLQYLQSFAHYENENSYVLYFHLKGIWSQNGKGNPNAIKSWRKCLEYFTIERWEDCVEKLDLGYEVVGALYNYNEKEPLFSGNFWWSTTDYIKKLPKLEYIEEKDPYKDLPNNDMGWCRVECEKWINKIPNKFYNFYIPKDYGFYFVPLEEKDYRKSNLEKYKISVLIPTYNRNESLKESIESVLKQDYKNLEILVCHDGKSEKFEKFVLDNAERYSKIKFMEIFERRNNYGAAQRNEMLRETTGDYILHLDDDNILYDGYLKKMTSLLDDETGMVVCRIHFNDKEWKNYVLPIEDKLQPCFIDQLGILFKSNIAKMFNWDDYFGHDHRYITSCENKMKEMGLNIKYIPDVLASHRYLGEIKSRITIFQHCYLRYNWKRILEDQIKLMKENGLYEECSEIFSTAYSEEESIFKEFQDVIKKEDVLNKWNIIKEYKNDNEFETLKLIKKYSEDKHAFICYFHLKGVISEKINPNIGVPAWRNYLNYFTINKWESNIEKLKEGNDVVCVDWNFNDMHQRYVLGGHFFWTTSEYIRTLEEPISNENRFLSEIWITSNEKVKVYENFNYEKIGFKNLYLEKIPETSYKKNRLEELLGERRLTHIDWDDNGVNRLFGLKDLISENLNKNSVVAEIGSFEGKSSELFALLVGKVYCIDPWELYDQVDDIPMMKSEEKFDKLLKIYDNVFKIKNYSKESAKLFKDEWFDCVYLDGNHDYESVKEDIITWIPKIEIGGFISGHDYHFEGVRKAIDEIFAKENIKVYSDKSWIVKLRNEESPKQLKEVVIMTSHPNYSGIENITLEAIKSFKDKGKVVILSSHTPLSIELQKAADYVVYDKNNPLIRHDFFTQSWFNTDDYHALIQLKYNDNNFNHALGVYLNYYNGFMLAKSLGYNTAICSNFDLIFHPEDIDMIDNKIKEMYLGNKKAFFMNTPEKEGTHFKTIFFMTNIDWYLNKFEYITNEKIYNEEIEKSGSETNCLENFIYHSLKNNTNELLLQEIDENTLFSKSRINMFSLIEYQTILPDQGCPHCFVVWFSSSNRVDDRKLSIIVNKNDTILETINEDITNEYRFYKKFRYEDEDYYEITFIVKNNLGEILKNKTIKVDKDIFNNIKSYGNFIFKKPQL